MSRILSICLLALTISAVIANESDSQIVSFKSTPAPTWPSYCGTEPTTNACTDSSSCPEVAGLAYSCSLLVTNLTVGTVTSSACAYGCILTTMCNTGLSIVGDSYWYYCQSMINVKAAVIAMSAIVIAATF